MNYNETHNLTNINFKKGDIITLNFTGNYKEVKLRPGTYKFECYGAQGGDMLVDGWTGKGGRGAVTTGTIKLTKQLSIFGYVGGAPLNGPRGASVGGWNGGGNSSELSIWGCSGGGASDIRLVSGSWDNLTSLRSRIMIAGAGGGSNDHQKGGDGGFVGENGQNGGGGGTQTTGGTSNQYVGEFGKGGGYQGGTYDGGGGGSGYYGGGNYRGSSSAGGGGSSFISGFANCNAINVNGIHTGQPNHFSGLIFYDSIIQAGINEGNGKIKITVIDTSLYLINDLNNASYMQNGNLINTNKTEDTLQLKTFEDYGMNGYEFQSPFLGSNILSLFISSTEDMLPYKFVALDQKIINTNYIELGDGIVLYKMQIIETLNSCATRFIFCIDDRWFWLSLGGGGGKKLT